MLRRDDGRSAGQAPGSRRRIELGTAVLALGLLGCPPTLSAPRSPAYVEALTAADEIGRHQGPSAEASAYGRAAQLADRRVDEDEARYRQARAQLRAGDRVRALAILDRLAARRPPSRRTARALYDASMLRCDSDERREGLAGLYQLVLGYPDSALASRALVVLVREIAPPESALRFLDQLYAHLGDSDLGDDVLDITANVAIEIGDRARATAALERIVADHPYPRGQRWDDALWRLADLAEADGEPARAAAYLVDMLSVAEATSAPGSYTRPRFPEAQIRLARLYHRDLGDEAAAREAYRAAYEDFPTSRYRDDALVEHGEMLLELGLGRDGCRLLAQAVEEFDVGSARRRAARRLASGCP